MNAVRVAEETGDEVGEMVLVCTYLGVIGGVAGVGGLVVARGVVVRSLGNDSGWLCVGEVWVLLRYWQ